MRKLRYKVYFKSQTKVHDFKLMRSKSYSIYISESLERDHGKK